MRVIVNPKYTHLQKQIEEIPKFFADEGKVVYDGRNILKRISLDNVDVVVKSFKKPHIINRVVYSYFRQSKAARSYIYSMELQKHGFNTPEPIAMIEQFQKGLLTNSYYVCCYDNGETVRYLMDGKVEGNEDKLLAFARYTFALHQAGILHLDYSPGNILCGVGMWRLLSSSLFITVISSLPTTFTVVQLEKRSQNISFRIFYCSAYVALRVSSFPGSLTSRIIY